MSASQPTCQKDICEQIQVTFTKLEDKIGSGHQQQNLAKGMWKWPTNFNNLSNTPCFFFILRKKKGQKHHEP